MHMPENEYREKDAGQERTVGGCQCQRHKDSHDKAGRVLDKPGLSLSSLESCATSDSDRQTKGNQSWLCSFATSIYKSLGMRQKQLNDQQQQQQQQQQQHQQQQRQHQQQPLQQPPRGDTTSSTTAATGAMAISSEAHCDHAVTSTKRRMASCCGWFKPQHCPSLESDKVPIEMRESYINTGYRPPSLGVAGSACSAFYMHNETLNFWTHMIPFIYFAYFLFIEQGPWIRLTLISPLGRYPFYGFMVGICALFGASSFAHLFHCAGQRRWRNVCFVMDYAAISVYGTASAIAYYFYSRPRFRGTFIGYLLSGEGHFLGFTTATAWVATFASCMTRLRPTRFCYAIRTGAFALPFIVGSFPAIARWLSAGAILEGPPAVVISDPSAERDWPGSDGPSAPGSSGAANLSGSVVIDTGSYRFPKLDYDFQTPYTRHLVMLAGGALINVLKIPERFCPGRFDTIGSSHQWFHILVFFSIREQFWLMLEEIACHSGLLYLRDPDSSMPWGRATIKPGQQGSFCTIITSTASMADPGSFASVSSSSPASATAASSTASSTSSSSATWFWPWGWSWNSLLMCALGNPRSNLDTWMALNTIAWMTILLGVLTITIVWFGYSYDFEFSDDLTAEHDEGTEKTPSGTPSKKQEPHTDGDCCHQPSILPTGSVSSVIHRRASQKKTQGNTDN